MRTTRVRLVVSALLLTLLPGCALLMKLFNSFTHPTLSFKTANLRDTDLAGTTLDLIFTLDNPNPVGLNLASVSYALEIEGHPIASGKPPDGANLAANARTDLTFPATVKFADVAQTLVAFLDKDTAAWKASGSMGISTPIGVIDFPLTREGTFPVPKLPAIDFEQPLVSDLSFSGARVTFPLKVTNRNSFPLPLGELAANISVSGTNLGSATSQGLSTLAAGETRSVSLSLPVNFLSVGGAVATALRGGSAQVKLDGSLRSGDATLPMQAVRDLVFR